jgi:hypothetical protein
MKADILKEFEEKYQSFELGEPIGIDQFRKLKTFISSVYDRGFEEGKKTGRNGIIGIMSITNAKPITDQKQRKWHKQLIEEFLK